LEDFVSEDKPVKQCREGVHANQKQKRIGADVMHLCKQSARPRTRGTIVGTCHRNSSIELPCISAHNLFWLSGRQKRFTFDRCDGM
jgi:hypothetical protein